MICQRTCQYLGLLCLPRIHRLAALAALAALAVAAVLLCAHAAAASDGGAARLTDHPAYDGQPSWSPDGSRIAFASNREGNREIYVMNADGSGVTRLTDHPQMGEAWGPSWSPDGSRIALTLCCAYKFPGIYLMNADGSFVTIGDGLGGLAGGRTPSWSPDGSRIAFQSDSYDGNGSIYVMNADGSSRVRLTGPPAWDWSPTWSPDGRRIAFASNRDGNREIYVMNADGSGVTRLTDHPASDESPSWSTDGGRIAFMSDRDGNRNIYVMHTDGSGVSRLTSDPADDFSPAWSPDGSRIAFVSNRDGNPEIYVMNVDGAVEPTQRTNAGGAGIVCLTNHAARDGSSSWSPDGSRIAFESNRDGNWEIYAMNADGSGVTRLTYDDAYDESPAWSPDGGRIAFVSMRDGASGDIYIMNADGSGVARLTDHGATVWTPTWSPDGSRIAFVSLRDGITDGNIYVMNADGTGVARLTDDPASDVDPAWSPDGSRIAFVSMRDGGSGNSDIYVMNADGSGVTRLTGPPGDEWSPTWSPDGGRIAFESDRSGNSDIYVMNADGSGVTRLTDHPEDDWSLAWSPDGGRIAFSSDRGGNDEICVMNVDGAGVSTQETTTTTETKPPPPKPPLSAQWDIVGPQGGAQDPSAVVFLSWEPVPGASGYVVLRRDGEAGGHVAISDELPATATSYTDGALTEGESYEYVVEVVQSGGEGTRSNGVRIEIPSDLSLLPEKPDLKIQIVNPIAIRVWWKEVFRAHDYELERRIDGGEWQPIEYVGDSRFDYRRLDYDLEPALYEYRVRGRLSWGESAGPWSNVAPARLGEEDGPRPSETPLAGVQGTSATQVRLAWTGVDGATSYEMEWCRDNDDEKFGVTTALVEMLTLPLHGATLGGSVVAFQVVKTVVGEILLGPVFHHYCVGQWEEVGVVMTETAYVDESASPGWYYYYKVRGRNPAGAGPWSQEVQVQPGISNLYLKDMTESESAVTLAWTGVDGVSAYEIDDCGSWWRSEMPFPCANSWQHRPDAPRNYYTKKLENLTAGREYHLRIRAHSDAGPSDWSNVVMVRPGVPFQPPAANAEMSSSEGAFEVRLSWQEVRYATGGYEVRRRDANGIETKVRAPGLEYTDKEVSYEGVYYYSVRGVNEVGEGPWALTQCSMMQYGGCRTVEWDQQ